MKTYTSHELRELLDKAETQVVAAGTETVTRYDLQSLIETMVDQFNNPKEVFFDELRRAKESGDFNALITMVQVAAIVPLHDCLERLSIEEVRANKDE